MCFAHLTSPEQSSDCMTWIPIGSMYGIYATIGDILMVNVTIYSIHASYGICCFPQLLLLGSYAHRCSASMNFNPTKFRWHVFIIAHRIHGAAMYGNMDPINIPKMSTYIPAPWILWVVYSHIFSHPVPPCVPCVPSGRQGIYTANSHLATRSGTLHAQGTGWGSPG